MAGRVIEILRSDPGSSHFFAFGVGHFLGQQGIVQLVREAGFTVERVDMWMEYDPQTLQQLNSGERSASGVIILFCLTLLANILTY